MTLEFARIDAPPADVDLLFSDRLPAKARASEPVTTFLRLHRWRESDATAWRTIDPAVAVRWCEETEYAFLRSRDLCVSLHDERGQIGFPRTAARVVIDPLPPRTDYLQTELAWAGCDGKRIWYRFRVRETEQWLPAPLENALVTSEHPPESQGAGRVLAEVGFEVCCCRFPDDRPPYAILIPEWVLAKLPT